MSAPTYQDEISPEKAKKMIDRIIRLEKRNLRTKQYRDKDMVDKIKAIIREEAEAYAD